MEPAAGLVPHEVDIDAYAGNLDPCYAPGGDVTGPQVPGSAFVNQTLSYAQLAADLVAQPARWLVTGAAGFIGSNLVLRLLQLDQEVVGLDNFATGYSRNLDQVRGLVSPAQWGKFKFQKGDIGSPEHCREACDGARYVLHQAALGSVPRSMEDPLACHAANVTGFLNMIQAATQAGVATFVYASSSAVYGDHPALPKQEDQFGAPLSPYAASKYMDEIYADVFARCYSLRSVGLRYFNVFGPRQDPDGAYAAVIPKWIASMIQGESVVINGDGETSRDFCYIANVVQANLLAAARVPKGAAAHVFNVACQERTTLNELFGLLRERLVSKYPRLAGAKPEYRDLRPGDVRHSEANISRARKTLGYEPTHNITAGLDEALEWYLASLA